MLQAASSLDDQYLVGHGTFYGLFSNVAEWWRTDKLVTGVGGNWRSKNVASISASDRAFADTIGFRLAIQTPLPPKPAQEAAKPEPGAAPEKRKTPYKENYAQWYRTLFGAEGPAEFEKVMALGDNEYWDLAYIRQVVLAGADDSMLGTSGKASRSLEALPDTDTTKLVSELLKEPPPARPK
jgi:hypothetical protein